MKVVESDPMVEGMLNDERARCEEALDTLNRALSTLPKGSLHIRIRRQGNKEYRYHYLKFREGTKVVNQHVSDDDVKELQEKLAVRKRSVAEMEDYKKRISYLNRILRKGSGNQKDR
jgi:hypothetical protein